MPKLMISLFITLLIIVSPALTADVLKPYKVTFRTTDCAGDTGLASVEVDRIEKIRGVDCGPGKNGRQLKQVLARPLAKSSGYEVYLVTAEDAGRIEKQINDYMDTRKKTLEGGKTLIIEQ